MSAFIPIPSFDPHLLEGSNLVLPSVSIGNVPQLTCDLFIHTLNLVRVGYVYHDSVIPVAGAREGSETKGVSVAVEVFQTNDRQWTMIQQRAPTLKGRRQDYVNALVEFIEKFQFSQVVLLASADAGRRTDAQITSAPFRVLGSPMDNAVTQQAVNLGVPVLENKEEESDHVPALPGSGLARPLFSSLKTKTKSKLPTTMFIMFALEGDNVQDSIAFANMLNTLFHFKPTEGQAASWTPPKSWELVFGTPFNQELYQ